MCTQKKALLFNLPPFFVCFLGRKAARNRDRKRTYISRGAARRFKVGYCSAAIVTMSCINVVRFILSTRRLQSIVSTFKEKLDDSAHQKNGIPLTRLRFQGGVLERDASQNDDIMSDETDEDNHELSLDVVRFQKNAWREKALKKKNNFSTKP